MSLPFFLVEVHLITPLLPHRGDEDVECDFTEDIKDGLKQLSGAKQLLACVGKLAFCLVLGPVCLLAIGAAVESR